MTIFFEKVECGFVPFFKLVDTCPFPSHLCGSVARVSGFVLRPVHKNLKHRDYAHEVQNAKQHLGMDPFFPELSCGVLCLIASVPRFGCLSATSTWISAATDPETFRLVALNSAIKQQNLFLHSFSASC